MMLPTYRSILSLISEGSLGRFEARFEHPVPFVPSGLKARFIPLGPILAPPSISGVAPASSRILANFW